MIVRIKDKLSTNFITKISEHRYKDQNGYLICQDAILGRTGVQEYLDKELNLGSANRVIDVYRDEEDVFDPVSLSSLEGRPITINHPKESVTSKNHSKLAKGFVKNVRRDGEFIIGDLVIQDEEAIELVETGKLKELSLGYDMNLDYDEDNAKYKFTDILYNHLAIVKRGRAGVAAIIDERKEPIVEEEKKVTDTEEKVISDEEDKEKDVGEEKKKKEEEEEVKDECNVVKDSRIDELLNRTEQIEKLLSKFDGFYDKQPEKTEVKDSMETLEKRIKELEEQLDKKDNALKIVDGGERISYDPKKHELKMQRYFKSFNPEAHDSLDEWNKFINKETKEKVYNTAIDRYLREGE